jgi:Putative Flp pilus-assembly TadE/G-like
MHATRRTGSAAGQAIVLMVGGMIAVITMVALIVDGGNAIANQRIVQNGSDAAAEAGAVVMAQRFAGATAPSVGWDQAVLDAINSTAAANGIAVSAAYYTDICGIPLQPDGTKALNDDGSYKFSVADRVGTGIPSTVNGTPNCPNLTVGPPAGVLVKVEKTVNTYLARVAGINTIAVGAQSTAASGYLQEACSADQGATCALLPLAITTDVITCTGQGHSMVDSGNQWVADGTTVYVIPICGDSAGNVGWLDWNPPNGGTAELITSISKPNNPAVTLPSWQQAAQPGNGQPPGLEAAIRFYDGKIVLVPQFDHYCATGSTPVSALPTINDASRNYGCSVPVDGSGGGANTWYRMPSFAHLQLCWSEDPACQAKGAQFGAYINGNDGAGICGTGPTSCLVGKFMSIVSTGTIGAGFGGGSNNSKAVGVQLIK